MSVTIRVRNVQSIRDAEVVIDGFTVITGPNNAGKALTNGTPVPTPEGWRPIECLAVGDLVLAGDGSPTVVRGVYPQGRRQTCVIGFNDGRSATVDLDHRWKVSIGNDRFPGKGQAQRWCVLSTRDVWDRVGDKPSRFQRPAIPRAGFAQYRPREMPLDPYLMGVLLGDGCFQPTSVRVSSADPEIVAAVQATMPDGVSLRKCGKYDYRLRTKRGQPNPVLDAVRLLGLSGKKSHQKTIPEAYLRNDVASRLALLQGLLDTDGTVSRSGIPEFCSTSRRLAEDVMEIIYSFGGTARLRSKTPTYTHNGQHLEGREAFTVTFRLPDLEVFRLPRKARAVAGLSRRVQPLMVSFQEGPTVPCTCIEVEHDSQLFQMEGHLVTHNTALMRAIKGVFLNSPPGPILRHGAAHLIVDIDFGDGNTVCWEKGWKKPGRKGGTINQYTVNGKLLANVGKSVPDEVLALGVQHIQAGGNRLWPQVADQFHGVLFLIGSPGSATAEAVADVERVGKLSAALKLSESDRRQVTSKVKIRRKDVEALAEELEGYDGLDEAGQLVATTEGGVEKAQKVRKAILDLDHLRQRRVTAERRVSNLVGVRDITIPGITQAAAVEDVRDDLAGTVKLRDRLQVCRDEVSRLDGIQDVPTPGDGSEAETARKGLVVLCELRDRHKRASTTAKALSGIQDVQMPSEAVGKKAQAIKSAIVFFEGLQLRRRQAENKVGRLKRELREAGEDLESTVSDVNILIDKLGVCPTCRKASDGHTHPEGPC